QDTVADQYTVAYQDTALQKGRPVTNQHTITRHDAVPYKDAIADENTVTNENAVADEDTIADQNTKLVNSLVFRDQVRALCGSAAGDNTLSPTECLTRDRGRRSRETRGCEEGQTW